MIQKESPKEIVHKYLPVTCVRMRWKILTTKVKEGIYYSLVSCRLFHEKKKRCPKESEERLSTVYRSTHLQGEPNESKNIAMKMINSKDILYRPAKLDIDCLKMYKISDKGIKLITEAMIYGKVELTARRKKY